MAFATASSSSLSSEINVTPLIDVLLVLLIIFMVIGPVASRGLESAVPQPGSPSIADSAAPLVVTLRSGTTEQPVRYSLGGEGVDPGSVAERLEAILARRPNKTVIVEADRSLSYQPVAAVVGEARRAGAGAVMLSVLRP